MNTGNTDTPGMMLHAVGFREVGEQRRLLAVGCSRGRFTGCVTADCPAVPTVAQREASSHLQRGVKPVL